MQVSPFRFSLVVTLSTTVGSMLWLSEVPRAMASARDSAAVVVATVSALRQKCGLEISYAFRGSDYSDVLTGSCSHLDLSREPHCYALRNRGCVGIGDTVSIFIPVARPSFALLDVPAASDVDGKWLSTALFAVLIGAICGVFSLKLRR